VLNASKGPAVRATRAQADRALYRQAIRALLEASPTCCLFQQAVDDLLVEPAIASPAWSPRWACASVRPPWCSPPAPSSAAASMSG
jgi:hypothetical protein